MLCLLARCLRHLLAGQLATARVEPEEHWLPAVTVPGPIMMMMVMMVMMMMWRRRMTVVIFAMRIKLEGRNIGSRCNGIWRNNDRMSLSASLLRVI